MMKSSKKHREALKHAPHYSSAIACRYVQHALGISGRALALRLGIHHTSWIRYARGERRPDRRIKDQLAKLAGAPDFLALIRAGLRQEGALLNG